MKEPFSGVVAGFITGVAIGVALGFLFSPISGKEIRGVFEAEAENISGALKETIANREKLYKESWKAQKELHTVNPYYRHESQ